mmetsp:Transcript_82870/g.215913  ORF Transcript_82870/g.215913 Transcript_82870/m.215913 type:complete len:680 (+) Transcript_82870:87-2126(+)
MVKHRAFTVLLLAAAVASNTAPCAAFEGIVSTVAVEQFAPPKVSANKKNATPERQSSKGNDRLVPESGEELESLERGLRTIFYGMDADGNGVLNETEVVAKIVRDSEWRYELLWILEGMRLTEAECKQLFKLLDADNSGTLDLQEFFLGADRLRGKDRKRAKEAIQRVVASEPAMDLGETSMTQTCSVTSTERCPMSDMPRDIPSLVFPGGVTRCLSDTDKLYAFRVYPGDTDKLYLDFQGGGACFNEYTTMNQTMCKTNIADRPRSGVYNKSDERNPFRAYTIVSVVYCSGDLHVGSTARPYGGIVQRGYANAQSAFDWAKENLRPRLESLVIGGCSAGSLAAQMWAPLLLGSFWYSHAVILADSYLDLFPGRTQERILLDLGICDTPLLSELRRAQCFRGNLTAHDLFEDAMAAYPTVTFAQVNSKYDKTQRYFHQAVAYTSGVLPDITNGSTYLAAVNRRLRSFKRYPNYVSFLVNGGQHCYTPFADFYTTTANGTAAISCGDGPAGHLCRARQKVFNAHHMKLVDWVHNLLLPRTVKHSDCYGKKLSADKWTLGGIAYCDEGDERQRYRDSDHSRQQDFGRVALQKWVFDAVPDFLTGRLTFVHWSGPHVAATAMGIACAMVVMALAAITMRQRRLQWLGSHTASAASTLPQVGASEAARSLQEQVSEENELLLA